MMKLSLSWITANWGLKIVSLLLAIGFWIYVVGEESIEVTKTVSLEIQPPTDKLSVVKSSTSFLEVTLQSPRHMFTALSSTNLSARHKIEGAQKAGDYSFNVSANDFSLPAPEIRIVKIFPSFITVTLDEVIVKKLPIEVELIGEPAFGYAVDKETIEIDPNAVLVEGPKAVLEKMDKIKTEPIQLVGRVRSFRRSARIHQSPELKIVGDGISELQIPIKAEFSEREFLDVDVKPLGKPLINHLANLEADRIPMILKGPRAILDKLDVKNILAYVEVENLKEGTYKLPIKIVLPPDLSLKDEVPALSVEVRKIKT